MDEFIQRLFFDCPYARFVWRVIQVYFNITPPLNIHHMFTEWMQGVEKKLRYKILVELCTLCWAMWLSRNDVVFDKMWVSNPMQVIFHGMYWIWLWTLLQKVEHRPQIIWRCRMLETTVMEIFASNGWNFSNIIHL
jgi:hypothetical protein